MVTQLASIFSLGYFIVSRKSMNIFPILQTLPCGESLNELRLSSQSSFILMRLIYTCKAMPLLQRQKDHEKLYLLHGFFVFYLIRPLLGAIYITITEIPITAFIIMIIQSLFESFCSSAVSRMSSWPRT